MAHIRTLDSGRYQVRYIDPSGRERARNFKRKVDADKFLVTNETQKLRGTWGDPRLAKTTFAEWEPRFTASRVHLRPTTRAASKSLMQNHVLPYFENRRLGAVTPTEVQSFVASLESKGLAPSTIRQAYLLAAGVFVSAVESDIIPRSPCRGINLPQRSRTEMRFLDAEAIGDLATAIGPRYRALVLTGAYTGCRFGELAGLRVHRLDLLRRTLTIAETLTEVQGKVFLGPPKTTAAARQVALPRLLAEELALHLEEWPPNAKGFVFTSTKGEPIRRTNFRRRAWLPAVRTSVSDPLRFHDLRHTHAAMLIALGEHPKLIQTRLGHSSIQVTLDTYGHLFEGLDQAAAERLDEVFPRRETDFSRTPRPSAVLQLAT